LDRLDQGRVEFRRGPKNYRRSDERVAEEIIERLMCAPRIDPSAVTVAVEDGTVTLEGVVPERWMRYAIESLAAMVWGVRDVDNRVRVARD
jgi:osmotically-inducible protein OsmY